MSYILDALRKSEHERHQGEVPHLGSNTMLIHAQRRERPLWPYLLAGALTLNGVALLGWLVLQPAAPEGLADQTLATLQAVPSPTSKPGHNDPEPALTGSAITQPAASLPTALPQAAETLEARIPVTPGTVQEHRSNQDLSRIVGATVPSEARPQAPSIPSTTPHLGDGVLITPDPSRQDITFAPPAQSSMPGTPRTPAAAAEPRPVETVQRLEDMPLAFRQRVPSLRFNSHIYSSVPDARRVMINNIYLREGQSYAGMQVREITEQGVIMAMDGISFEVSAERDWVNP